MRPIVARCKERGEGSTRAEPSESHRIEGPISTTQLFPHGQLQVTMIASRPSEASCSEYRKGPARNRPSILHRLRHIVRYAQCASSSWSVGTYQLGAQEALRRSGTHRLCSSVCAHTPRISTHLWRWLQRQCRRRRRWRAATARAYTGPRSSALCRGGACGRRPPPLAAGTRTRRAGGCRFAAALQERRSNG
eukprot:6193182-Pleurochrysis_carterae.AAC.5